MICIYHNADIDGHCSGAIVKLKYPNATMIGMDYDDELPIEIKSNEDIIVVDFHLQPFDKMLELMTKNNVTWIDHHKSAIDDYQDAVGHNSIPPRSAKTCFLTNALAACEITWKVLHPDELVPPAVYLAGRYDVWDHSDPDTLPFQFGVRLLPTNPMYEEAIQTWNKLFYAPNWVEETIMSGKLIINYVDSENAKVCAKSAYPIEFEGHKAIACNRSLTNLKLFDSIDMTNYDMMIVYYYTGRRWLVSLYSTKMDVSEIATKYGGGGHAQAAGFLCDVLPPELWGNKSKSSTINGGSPPNG